MQIPSIESLLPELAKIGGPITMVLGGLLMGLRFLIERKKVYLGVSPQMRGKLIGSYQNWSFGLILFGLFMTVLPNFMPTPPRPLPNESVVAYWKTVDAHNFRAAWNSLTSAYKIKNHKNDYLDYEKGFKSWDMCRISAEVTDITPSDKGNATVSTKLLIISGKTCESRSEATVYHHMVFAESENKWLINDTTTPP